MKTVDFVKYRNHWMGIAILGIVLYHTGFEFHHVILKGLQTFGYSGVDIFLFASGIGCYYSLQKDSDLIRFMKRRCLRILPAYWIFMCFWCPYQKFVHGMRLKSIIGNVLCVQYFTGIEEFFNWYMGAIWILYLLAPFLKGLLDRYTTKKVRIAFLIFLIAISIPFWQTPYYLLSMTRMPIFYIGMWFGCECQKSEMFTQKDWIFAILALGMGIGSFVLFYRYLYDRLWDLGLNWYPFILIMPGFCMLLSKLFYWMDKNRITAIVTKGIAWIGKYSFEIFLTHIFIFHLMGHHFSDLPVSHNVFWVIAVLLVIPATALLHMMTIGFQFIMSKKKGNNGNEA